MTRATGSTRKADIRLQRELGILINQSLRDRRLAMVSVTGMRISRDYACADVYITALGDEAECLEIIKVLNGAAGFLRSRLALRVKIRKVPRIKFFFDPAVRDSRRVEALLSQLPERHNTDTGQVSE